MGPDGNIIFFYGSGNQSHACIKLSMQHPGSILLQSQPVTLMPPKGERVITIQASEANNPILINIWNQLSRGQLSIEQFNVISHTLHSIDPMQVSESEIFLYNSILILHNSYQVVTCPQTVPEASQQPQGDTESPPLMVTQPEPASYPTYTTQQSVETIIESSAYCESLYNLQRENPQGLKLSYGKIANAFTATTKASEYATGGKKKQRPGKDLSPKKGNLTKRSPPKKAYDPWGIGAIGKALAKEMETSSQRSIANELFSEKLAKRINAFIHHETSHNLKRHRLLFVPYLGSAQCSLATSGEADTYGNPALAKELEPVLLGIMDELIQDQNDSFDTCEQEFALLSVLLLKYSAYSGCNATPEFNSVIQKLAETTKVIAGKACDPTCSRRGGIWKIIPTTLLAMVTMLSSKKSVLTVDTSENIVECLGPVMQASLLQGDFDLSAASICVLRGATPSLNCYQETPKLAHLLQQIPQFFHTLHATMTNAEAGSHTKIRTAQTTLDIIGDLQALKEKWPSLQLSMDDLQNIEEAAKSVLQKRDDDLQALDDAIKESAKQAREKEKQAKDKLATYRKQKMPPPQVSEPDATPVSKAEAPKPPKEPQWSIILKKAITQIELGNLTTATQLTKDALSLTQTKVDKACVHTCCADAHLLSCKPLIDLACYLGNRCNNEMQKMEEVLCKARACSPELVQTKEGAQEWLKTNPISSPSGLANLAIKFPTMEKITTAATAINNAIVLYSQALEALKDCSTEEQQEHGQFLLEIMEADMVRLHKQQVLITSAKKNLIRAMEIRPEILYRLGFYGEERETVAKPEAANPKRKHWLTTTREQFRKQTDELSELFLSPQKGKKNPLKDLIEQIQGLKEKAKTT